MIYLLLDGQKEAALYGGSKRGTGTWGLLCFTGPREVIRFLCRASSLCLCKPPDSQKKKSKCVPL